MTRKRLPFTRLQAFEAVARLGSFKAAREELGSNVGRHVAELETDLGITLIKSSPRGELTREGKALALHLTNQFDDTASLLDQLKAGRLEPEAIAAILHLGQKMSPGDQAFRQMITKT